MPAARALAASLGVELSVVEPSGPDGTITRADVERAAEAAALGTLEELRGVRRAIARHMQEARRRAAHFTYVEELDVTELMARRARVSPQLSPLAFIARAVLRVLPAYPRLNASIDDERGEVVLKGRIHLGIAAAGAEGLVVPVISNAAILDTRSLSEQIGALAERAREGTLVPAQLRGGTFTISSLGKLGGVVSTDLDERVGAFRHVAPADDL